MDKISDFEQQAMPINTKSYYTWQLGFWQMQDMYNKFDKKQEDT